MFFDDQNNTDHFQKEVYEAAYRIASSNNLESVVDVGCGSAFKLLYYFNDEFKTTGIDIGSTYDYLIRKYPEKDWLNGEGLDYSNIFGEIVICSDVIEHVLDPDVLLNNLKKIKGIRYLVLSTPDRLLARGWYDFGPPQNITHIREWNGKEFSAYIQSMGFDILSHQVTNYPQTTQMVICQIK